MKDATFITAVCLVLSLVTYAVLKIESMTDYFGWLAIPAGGLVYFVTELAVKRRYRRKDKERPNRGK